MAIRSDEIVSIIKSAIDQFDETTETRGVGTVVMGNSTSYDVDGVTDAVAQPWLRQPS